MIIFTEIDDEDDWATSDEAADDDNDRYVFIQIYFISREMVKSIVYLLYFFPYSNSVVAESALDRISCGLGGKTVFQHILNLTPQMLQQPDWKFRHAALMAISGLFAYYLCIFAKKKFLVKCLFTFRGHLQTM